MDGIGLRFTVGERVSQSDLADSLTLALLAVEGLFGAAAMRTDVRCQVGDHAILVSTDAEAGRAVARVLAQFLAREFGDSSFRVASVRPGRPGARGSARGARVMDWRPPPSEIAP
jgi:hypothetical protein